MSILLKELKGHSGSNVALYQNDTLGRFVRKTGNVTRNYERLAALHGIVPVPLIYYYDGNVLDMEYIHGYDIKNWLTNNPTAQLTNFLVEHLSNFAQSSVEKDYSDDYESWLSDMEVFDFPFSKLQLLEKLPKILPKSNYHGDMTLENIIAVGNEFYFIDPVTLPFDSYIFDIAKLRQDLDCRWFLRDSNIKLETKLQNIRDAVLDKFPESNNDYILILMLLRVYRHCKKDSLEHDFIIREVNRLWK